MAILWPIRSDGRDQTNPSDFLRRALSHVVTLVEGGAGVLALRPSSAAREESARAIHDESGELTVVAWGIEHGAARRLVALLATDRPPEPLDGRPLVTSFTELWAGEIATLTLGDDRGTAGELHLLGRMGFAETANFAQARRRRALLGEVVVAARQHQEITRLRDENRQLGSILHFSGDGIVTVDANLRITGFNPAMEGMTVWHAHEVLGRFYYDVLRPRDRQGQALGLDRDPLVQAIGTGQTVANREIVLLTRDGQPVDVSVTAAAVRSPQGQPISGVLNVRDITRSREAEELRSTFVSVVSHELQTPIAIIKGYASTLRREDATWDTATLRGRLTAIEDEADRLNHLVSNILYASRIQAGGLTMERAELNLADVVRGAVRRFKARDPQLDVRVRLPANCPSVLADRERIEEVVLNLLDNAVKYAPRGRRVRVSGEVTASEVVVHIADLGQGIPLREQERIFQRFQRVDNVAARQTQGAGLGLYICRAIVEAHGGHIWVHSELGQGSTFSFGLPREEPAQLPLVIFGDESHDVDSLASPEPVAAEP
ncbi:MAG TPA: ATP-binding protein [Ktedonobacterales bacterium]|jgi:PAS domain S-box-containing protein|nr:ATP-binding protein [Ktedonobacterales bacterium]